MRSNMVKLTCQVKSGLHSSAIFARSKVLYIQHSIKEIQQSNKAKLSLKYGDSNILLHEL